MKHLSKIIFVTAGCLVAPMANANLSYNEEHFEAMKNLSAVESASLNLHYQCGKFSLFISSFATQSDLNGRDASITGKITGENTSYDISKDLSTAISRDDILTGQMSVVCNAEKGAFRIEITPNAYAKETAGEVTLISIYSDGTVSGITSF